jgi:Transposase DDE domain
LVNWLKKSAGRPAKLRARRPGLRRQSLRGRDQKAVWLDDGNRAKRETGKKGWQLLPKRWVVERTFAWLYRQRTLWRNARGQAGEHAEANLFVWMVRLMTRRLAGQASKWHNQLALNPA